MRKNCVVVIDFFPMFFIASNIRICRNVSVWIKIELHSLANDISLTYSKPHVYQDVSN